MNVSSVCLCQELFIFGQMVNSQSNSGWQTHLCSPTASARQSLPREHTFLTFRHTLLCPLCICRQRTAKPNPLPSSIVIIFHM